MKTRPTTFLLSILAALFFLLPAVTMAQDESPPPLAEMWLATPKAGHGSEFKEALARQATPVNGRPTRRCWVKT